MPYFYLLSVEIFNNVHFFWECFCIFVQLSEYTSNRFILNSLRQDPLFSHLFILRGYKEIWFVVLIIREEVFSSPKKHLARRSIGGRGDTEQKHFEKKWGGGGLRDRISKTYFLLLSLLGRRSKQKTMMSRPNPRSSPQITIS